MKRTMLVAVTAILSLSGVAVAGVSGGIPIPEPATLALLAAGLGALALAKFRRRK
jgi:hypothetical protein